MEIELNEKNFKEEVLDSKLPVLVDFWAEWCVPCQMIAPVVKKLSEEYEGKLKVCKLNVDDNPGIAAKYGIMSIPTLILFKDGKIIDQIVGALPEEVIEERIKKNL